MYSFYPDTTIDNCNGKLPQDLHSHYAIDPQYGKHHLKGTGKMSRPHHEGLPPGTMGLKSVTWPTGSSPSVKDLET